MKYVVTVQSANRSENVERIQKLLEPIIPTWYVPEEQVDAYKKNADNVIGVIGQLPMKAKQLNAALNNDIVVTMDDDFNKASVIYKTNKARSIHISEVLDESVEELKKSPYYLAGFPSTQNPFFSRMESQNYGMVTGQLLIHKKSNIRFDETLHELEDLDYIIQHHIINDGVLRINRFLVNFDIIGRTKNPTGGYIGLRTEETQRKTVEKLREKYPHLIFEDRPPGESVQKKIKWKNIKPKATLW